MIEAQHEIKRLEYNLHSAELENDREHIRMDREYARAADNRKKALEIQFQLEDELDKLVVAL